MCFALRAGAVFAQAALPSGVKRPVRELHEGRSRAVGLQTAAPAAAARLAALPDDDMSQLARKAVAAGIQLSVDDNAAAERPFRA